MQLDSNQLTQGPVQDDAGRAFAGGRAAPSKRAVMVWSIAALALGAWIIGLMSLWAWMQPFLPKELPLNVFGRTLTVHNIHDKVSSSGLLILLLCPLAFTIETVWVGWEKCSLRRILFDRNESIKMDLGYFIADRAHITSVLAKLLTFGVSVGFGVMINERLSAALGFRIGLNGLPEIAQIFVYFWVYTFFDYWTHRFDHSRFFWPIHRFHHSTQDFCILTAMRAHPAGFMGIFVISLPMAILGAPVSVMIAISILVNVSGQLNHSSIDSHWGWFGRWVIQSPNHHRLHHILDITNPVGHFAIAPVWDHVFGTWVSDDTDQSLVIGVDTPYRQGYFFLWDMTRDYVDFWKGLGGGALQLLGIKRAMSEGPKAVAEGA